jgi:hypothetical protein
MDMLPAGGRLNPAFFAKAFFAKTELTCVIPSISVVNLRPFLASKWMFWNKKLLAA